MWPYWTLTSNPEITYTIHCLANMHPNWECYIVMKADTGGMFELFTNENLSDGTLTQRYPDE